MKIITSPSKTQSFNGRHLTDHSLPALLPMTVKVINKLRELDISDLSRLMKTSEKLTASTRKKILSFAIPFSPETAKQALFTFRGDAYSGISAGTYTLPQLHHAQHHLFILSGLYGALRPLDLMMPYRLEMGCPLQVGGAANLYTFWRDQVTATVDQAMSQDPDNILINLASSEYSRVINRKKLRARMVTIIFRQPHKGGYRTIPIHTKRARGKLIHFMISNGIDRADQLKDFNLDRYHYSSKDSNEDQWLFFQRP